MAIYNINGLELNIAYNYMAVLLNEAYDIHGNKIFDNEEEPPVIEDSEIISILVDSSTFNNTTYENVSDTNNWIIGPGTLKANRVNFKWDTEECSGFQFKIAIYDLEGQPYMHSNKSTYWDSAFSDGEKFYGPMHYHWVEAGSGSAFTAINGGNFTFKLPAMGTFKISIRRSGGSGTKVTSNATFGSWLHNGGLTVTALYVEEDFDLLWLPYKLSSLINDAWGENAKIQRNLVLEKYNNSSSAIPFFVQTDGHGKYNDGNVGCYNLSEKTMKFIRNLQLGDYASYYHDGDSAEKHLSSSSGLVNYIPVIGNHELLNNNSEDAELASLPVLVNSFVAKDGILGSETYGYYKVIDDEYKVKYLIGQPYIPDEHDSGGFIVKYLSDQFEWFIDEMEANDGYDIVILNHQEYECTITWRDSGNSKSYTGGDFNLTPILRDRKQKLAGTFLDSSGVTHSYDFTQCTSDLLCVFHGHSHTEGYAESSQNGYPICVFNDLDNNATCTYGIIDREHGKLYTYVFSKSSVSEPFELNL